MCRNGGKGMASPPSTPTSQGEGPQGQGGRGQILGKTTWWSAAEGGGPLERQGMGGVEDLGARAEEGLREDELKEGTCASGGREGEEGPGKAMTSRTWRLGSCGSLRRKSEIVQE